MTKGSRVTLLGSDGRALPWRKDAQGRVVVRTPAAGAASTSSKHAYTFKVSTPGVHSLARTRTELPPEIRPGATADGTLTVTNTARRRAPETRVTLSAPVGWKVTPASTRVGPLAPGADAKVPFKVTPPASAAPGTYDLDITTRHGRITSTTKVKATVALENLALGRAATQRSTGYDSPAARAVDGNTEGSHGAGSVTHTAEPSNQAWWQVDLGAASALGQVDIWNRTDCCADRLKNYWVLASDSPITADSLEEARKTAGVTAVRVAEQAGSPGKVTLPPGTTARHVRIQLESPTDPLSLAEVQVRGVRAD